jgi:type IV pilus assembly protein PilC
MGRRIRAALTYPCVLLLLMLMVIVVLLSRVLPVFDDVYASLGGQLTGIAGGLLALGRWLDAAMPVLCAVLAVVVALVLAFSLSDAFRDRLLCLWRRKHGHKGVSGRLTQAHFAQALTMGLYSGLPLEEAVELCAALLEDVPIAADRCRDCARRLVEGGELAETLQTSEMLPASACRLLTLGMRSGSGDAVMEDIARRLSDDADQALERRVAQVEPTLVLATSLLVGAILLSVMLPLMNIMTAIG